MTVNMKSAWQILEKLYVDRNETGDVTFLVESQRIRAHRWVLAAASPKFKAQFYGPNMTAGDIEIPNVSVAAFNQFLQFFYKESITLTLENIEEVLNLAKQSLVDEFIANCISFLKRIMTSKNICWIYLFAITYEIDSLRRECERQISKNTKKVFASEEFPWCNHDLLLRILKIDSLNCTETDVFNACIAWARANCKQKKLDDAKIENLREALGDAIYQIRFASMKAKEFAALHKSLVGFFTPDEIVEILYITSKLEGFESQKFNQKQRFHPDTYSSSDYDEYSEYSVELDDYDNFE